MFEQKKAWCFEKVHCKSSTLPHLCSFQEIKNPAVQRDLNSLAADLSSFQPGIAMGYRCGAKQQHTEDGPEKAEYIKRRFVVVSVDFHFLARVFNTFVFHDGWLFVIGTRKLQNSVEKFQLFGNNF
jgi:hypothetical protein